MTLLPEDKLFREKLSNAILLIKTKYGNKIVNGDWNTIEKLIIECYNITKKLK